jgi:diguanylate cyclase (GGDEF)-like protein/PAS domain S-box-containing protein
VCRDTLQGVFNYQRNAKVRHCFDIGVKGFHARRTTSDFSAAARALSSSCGYLWRGKVLAPLTRFALLFVGYHDNTFLQIGPYPMQPVSPSAFTQDSAFSALDCEGQDAHEQLLLLQASIQRLNDIVVITDAGLTDGKEPRIVFVNDAFERQTGYSRGEVLGKTARILHGRQTQRSELIRIRQEVQAGRSVRSELIHYKKNGELFWLELEIVPVDYFDRGFTHWVSVARDITERKASEDEIEHLAFYDALTQLPNRQLLMDRLEYALLQREGVDELGALMFIDLDNFKSLNDTLGHSKGDLLLQQVASRLSGCIRFSNTVARLGGDEFVVMLENLGRDAEMAKARATIVAEKILVALSEPYDLIGYQHHSTCSIGITFFSKRREQIGDLLKQADLAMYQAKASGRNTLCFFDPAMQALATANAALNSELRQGLRQQQFVLHYQPQVGGDGKMFGVEALVRWLHPQRGLVMPDEFIAQAEESGLILPLGEWVLMTDCAQLAAWRSGRKQPSSTLQSMSAYANSGIQNLLTW